MKLFKTEDGKYLLWVDETTPIDQYDWITRKDELTQANDEWDGETHEEWKKVVAYLPLTLDAVPLEGVPLLPELSKQEEYVEQLAEKYAEQFMSHKDDKLTVLGGNRKNAFIAGYKAASQDRKFSEEDLRMAINMARQCQAIDTSAGGTESIEVFFEYENDDEIIQSLSPATPLPTEFLPEMEIKTRSTGLDTGIVAKDSGSYKVRKTITLPNGQQQLVGRYQYKEDNHD